MQTNRCACFTVMIAILIFDKALSPEQLFRGQQNGCITTKHGLQRVYGGEQKLPTIPAKYNDRKLDALLNWETIKENGWPKKDCFKILSIDGGGIRGLFPAKYLSYIEEDIGGKIYEHFDLITGTSTGGIIALALSLGIPAQDIAKLYQENARRIFKRRFGCWGGFLGAQYTNAELIRLLKDTFGDTKMKDAQTMLCIPSVEHCGAKPKVYKTPHHPQLHIDQECAMWEVALATSAAPYYFPAATLGDGECKLDGGIWSNNPILVGVAEAMYNGYSLDCIKVLSLGTGESAYQGKNKRAQKGGKGNWRLKIIDFIVCTQSEGVINTAKYILGDNLTRINFQCEKGIKLDAVDDETLNLLCKEAKFKFASSFRNNEQVYSKFYASS